MKRTIEILESCEDRTETSAYVVLTLSGFNADFGSQWSINAKTMAKRIQDPYVRAMLSFLTEPYNEYSECKSILKEKNINVQG